MRTLILGDLHLGDGGPWDQFAGHQALPALLEAYATPPTRVILNGDALDFLRAEARVTGLDPQPAARQAEAIVRRWRPVFQALGRTLDGGGEVVFRLGSRDAPLALGAVQAVVRRALGDRRGVRFERGDRPALLRMGTARLVVTHGAHADPLERLDYRRLPEDGESTPYFRLGRGAWLTRNVLHPLLEEGVALAGLVGPAADRGVLAAAAVAPAAFARVLAQRGLAIHWDALGRRRGPTEDPADLTPVIERLDLDAVDRAELREALERDAGGVGVSAWQIRALRAFAEVHGSAEGLAFDLHPHPDDRREARRLRRLHEADAVVLGHRHAAAFFHEDGLLHLNPGGWLPRLRLPPADADDGRFRDVLELLQGDPRFVGPARRLRLPAFTAALIEPEGEGAVASLLAWRDGRAQVVDAGGAACTAFIGTSTTSFCRAHARGPAALPAPAGDGRHRRPAAGRRRPARAGPALPRHPPPERLVTRPQRSPATPTIWPNSSGGGRRHRPLGVYRDALAPLIALREAQMDAHAPVLEVDPGLVADLPGATAWMRDAWQQLPVHRRPGYLLLLGDLDELPLALQQVLGSACAVGRLAFTDAQGAPRLDQYRVYADKVVRHAWHPLEARRTPCCCMWPRTAAAPWTRASARCWIRALAPSGETRRSRSRRSSASRPRASCPTAGRCCAPPTPPPFSGAWATPSARRPAAGTRPSDDVSRAPSPSAMAPPSTPAPSVAGPFCRAASGWSSPASAPPPPPPAPTRPGWPASPAPRPPGCWRPLPAPPSWPPCPRLPSPTPMVRWPSWACATWPGRRAVASG
ncbi:MAG: hypothetical protein R3F43_28000 [bacterium]